MTIIQAINNGLKIGDVIQYKPKRREITLMQDETGYKEKQKFSTENMNWIFKGIKDGKAILVSEKPTTEKLFLAGMTGYIEGCLAQQKIADLYYNPGIEAMPMTLEQFFELEKETKIIKIPYWISSAECKKYFGNYHFVMRTVESCGINNICLANPQKESCQNIGEYGVRIVLFLSFDVELDGNRIIVKSDNKDVNLQEIDSEGQKHFVAKDILFYLKKQLFELKESARKAKRQVEETEKRINEIEEYINQIEKYLK